MNTEEIYQAAFNNELEKSAVSSSALAKSIASRLMKASSKAHNQTYSKDIKNIANIIKNKSDVESMSIGNKSLRERFSKVPGFSKELASNSAIETKRLINNNIRSIQSSTKAKKIGPKEMKIIRSIDLGE